MASSQDADLFPSVPEAICLFISVTKEPGKEDAVIAILLVGVLEEAGQPQCGQNIGLNGPLVLSKMAFLMFPRAGRKHTLC